MDSPGHYDEHPELTAQQCNKPPAGWYCTRGAGHEGPCAAKKTHDMKTIEADAEREPIPMLLYCPDCGTQHIDAPKACSYTECEQGGMCYCSAMGEPNRCDAWTNPPHRSHLCHACDCIWRPADVPTVGVASIATKGKADTWLTDRNAMPARVLSPVAATEPERKVFAAWWCRDIPKNLREEWTERTDRKLRDGCVDSDRLQIAWEGFQYGLTLPRAQYPVVVAQAKTLPPIESPVPIDVVPVVAQAERIYISGPITDMPELNKPAFDGEAARLKAQGYSVYNPQDIPFPQQKLEKKKLWQYFMKECVANIPRCSVIRMLPGWEKSAGATEELRIAQMLGLRVEYCEGAAPVVAQAEAKAGDDARECLLDVISHHDNFVAGLRELVSALVALNDKDGIAYWQREIDVAVRMKGQAERALAIASDVQTGKTADFVFANPNEAPES